MHGTRYAVHCTRYTVHYTLYTVHCTLYTVHCTLYTVHCTLYTEHGTLYTEHGTQNTVHGTLYTVHETLYTVYYTRSLPQVGLDLVTGEAMYPGEAGIWDNYCVKKQLLNSCTVISSNLLIVDEVSLILLWTIIPLLMYLTIVDTNYDILQLH